MGKVIDDSAWKESEESKAMRDLTFEKAQLESDLEVSRVGGVHFFASFPSDWATTILVLRLY